MHSNEWPLIVFTLAVQCAVGMVIGLTIIYEPLSSRVGLARTEDLAVVLLIFVLVLLIGAGVGATLHLGNVRNAYLVLSNWRTSWLSREVLLVITFGGSVVAYLVINVLGFGEGAARVAAGAVSSLLGLALVAAIARLYMLRTVPAWNRSATPLTFSATTLLLGCIGLAIAVVLVDGASTERLQRALCVLTLLGLGGQLAVFEIHRRRLSNENGVAAVSGRLVNETFAAQTLARSVLLWTGAAVLVLALVGWLPLIAGFLVAGALIVGSETVGRYLFYASYARSGL